MLVGEKMPGSAATLPGGGRKGGGESAYVNKYNPAYNNSSTRNNQADNSPNAAAALAYVQLPEPFAIFPVWWVRNDRRCACGNPECHNPGKHPIGKLVPNGHKDATTDPATVRRWWAQYPRANIGWALPAHIGVVDVDPRNGGEVDALPLTWAERGTLAARTGGGGAHLVYRLPGDGRVFTCGKLGDGLDFKTRGGYVVLAPSTHASGNTYQWEPGQGPRDVEILPAPPALLNILPLESRPRAVGEGFTASPVSDTLRERMTWVLSELCADFDPAVTEGMLICPFHNDTHASLSYHLGRGVFYCYGDGCEAHKRGNGVIELERLARVRHGLVWRPPEAAPDPTPPAAGAVLAAEPATVLPEPAPLPAPRPVLPWAILPDDWKTCPLCAAWHHSARATAGGLALHLHHKLCHKRDCELSAKVRAGDLLTGVEDWQAIYAAMIPEPEWNRNRLRMRRAGARWLGIPTNTGEVWTLCDAPDVLPGAAITADLGAIYQAVLDAPARVRRPHRGTVVRMNADDYAALTVDLGELPTVDVTRFSPEQPKHERVTVLGLEMAAPEPPAELVAIARHLTALGRFLPPEAGDRVRAAWANCGIVREGNRAVATLEQGRQLVDELQAIRREVTHAGMIELTHIGGVGPYALNRSSAPDAPPTGCASPDSKATEGGGNGETC